MTEHPKYDGPVIDCHVHYDASTRAYAPAVNATGGLSAAIQLWDLAWPPEAHGEDEGEWQSIEPALLRCHVPDYSRPDTHDFETAIAREMQKAAATGAVGIKVWKNLGLQLRDRSGGYLRPDDPRFGVVWETAAELSLPVLIHVGDPAVMWAPVDDTNPRIRDLRTHPDWWYGGGEHPSLEELHWQLESIVADNRDTTFIGAHFGCFMAWREVRRMLSSYANYNVDTSAAIAEIGYYERPDARDVIMSYPDRVLFGTDLVRTAAFDYPNHGAAARWDLEEYFRRHWAFFETDGRDLEHPIPEQLPWRVDGFDLPLDVLEKLYYRNSSRVFNVNVAAKRA